MAAPAAPIGPGTLTDPIYYEWLHPDVANLHFGAKTGKFAGVPYNWLTNWAYYEIKQDGTILTYGPESLAAADALMTAAKLSGWPIDWYIMVENQSPKLTMEVRIAQKIPYVQPYPSTTQISNPNDPMPGVPSNFPPTMPPGWLLTSDNAHDFPNWLAAQQPTTPTQVAYTPGVGEFAMQDPATGLTHYYFPFASGQNPPNGYQINYMGMRLQASIVAGAQSGPVFTGIVMRAWMLVGLAS